MLAIVIVLVFRASVRPDLDFKLNAVVFQFIFVQLDTEPGLG